MITASKKSLAIILIMAGVISLVFCGVFVYQGFSKSNLIAAAMRIEKASYGSAEGDIVGIIDTSSEASVMSSVLREHRLERYGVYTELERDDPNRETILKAMTMESALNLAILGYGVTDVVKANGAFMGIIGITFIFSGIIVARSSKISLQ